MKAALTLAEVTPQNYVQNLRLRVSRTRWSYLRILKSFQDFVGQTDRSICTETVRQWLNDRTRVWPLHRVMDGGRLVDRFLNWIVKKGALPHNPFAKLRMEYGQRTTAPIVRALLNPDFQAALESLRPAPRFGSFLGPVMREDVALMQAMGYRYSTQEQRFLRLDRFLQGRPDLSGQALAVVIREWASTRSGPQQILECHLTARSLSRALSRKDPATQKIPWERRIKQQAHQSHRRPYIFNEREIQCLLATALSLPSPQCPLRPHTAHMMLVLAYCSGLRVGEIVRLNIGDFDGSNGEIDIRSTKFFKSRRLPLSTSVVAALQSYLKAHQQAGAPTNLDAAFVLASASIRSILVFGDPAAAGPRPATLRAEASGRTHGPAHSRLASCLRSEPHAHVVPRRDQSAITSPLPSHLSRSQGHQLHPSLSQHHPGSAAASQ